MTDLPAPQVDPDLVAARAAEVRRRVAQAGGGSEVEILAVTKGFGPDAVLAAMRCGLTSVGENYAQELIAKAGSIPDGVRPQWHFLFCIVRWRLVRMCWLSDCSCWLQ